MKRLKGLDEMPARTGLEIDWDPDRRGAYSGRSVAPGASTSLRSRIVSLVLACMVASGGVYVIGLGFVPSPDQIGREMDRRWKALAHNRNEAGDLAPATRPAMTGAPVIGETTSRSGSAHVRTFPAGIVDYFVPEGSGGTPIDIVDVTDNGLPKVVRLKSLAKDRVWLTGYLAPGDTIRVTLPPGGYQVFITQGVTWYGPDEQFRDYGTYFEPQNLDVRQGQHLRLELPPASGDAALDVASAKDF